MNMSNITFQVPTVITLVFNKSSEKKIFTIIFVVKSLIGFGWKNVGPADGGPTLCPPYGSQTKLGTITQFCFDVEPASNTIDRNWDINWLRRWPSNEPVLSG